MRRIVLIVLSVAALIGYLTFDDARHDVTKAMESRCAAFAAADVDCPYSR